MPHINVIVIIIIGILGLFLVALLLMPSEPKRKGQPHNESQNPSDLRLKEWEALPQKQEKHIHSLRAEIETLKAQERKTQKVLAVEKEKNAKLQEKVAKEKEWLVKEEESLGRKDKEVLELKQNLTKVENDFEREYSAKLKLEQQLKDLRSDHDSLTKESREQSLKIMRLEGELDLYKKELAKLKKLNEELSKKSDETQWIAKTEFDKLTLKLKEKEKEIERLSRDN